MYGEQWYFTFTAEAFETHLKLQTAGAEEEKARLEAEAEVRISVSLETHCPARMSITRRLANV